MTRQFINSIPSFNDKSSFYLGPTADASATRANHVSSRKFEYTWIKPDGCKFIFITIAGGGSGGGGGGSYPVGSNSGGGGGGGGSQVIHSFYNAITIPNILYISPGCGGLRGAGGVSGPGSAGLDGTPSIITFNQSNSSSNGILMLATGQLSTQSATYGANGGTSATGGAAGGNYDSNGVFNNLFSLNFTTFSRDSTEPIIAPAAGGSGGLNVAGNNVVHGGGNVTFGGGGGGGVSTASVAFKGGDVYPVNNGNSTVSGLFEYARGGTSGVNGESGFKNCSIRGSNIYDVNLTYPFVQCGGAGGGGQVNGNGGNGGDGSWGSGGGGGGGAVGTGVTGGNGGNGGPGFVIITPIF
jgi:hypothetical protein